jgi:hypothetical protein
LTIEKNAAVTKKQPARLLASALKIVKSPDEPVLNLSQQVDTLVKNTEYPEQKVNKVPVFAEINLNTISVSNTLIANNSTLSPSTSDDGRSKLSRFLAKNFREKILKFNAPVKKSEPLP